MSAQIQLPIAQHTPEDLVFVSQTNQIATDSFLVAKFFGKRHDNIIQKIKSLDCSHEFTNLNFKVCHKNNELQNNKLQPFYQMTKDGFMFLVMGFTGKKAAVIKEAYINAFNLMAEKLSKPTTEKLALYKDAADLKSHVNFRMLIDVKNGEPQTTTFIPNDTFICNKARFLELLTQPRIFSDKDVVRVFNTISSRLPKQLLNSLAPKQQEPKQLPPPKPVTAKDLVESKPNHDIQIIRVSEVMRMTGLARSTLYAIAKKDDTFPKHVQLGASSVGWVKHEIEEWVHNRVNAR